MSGGGHIPEEHIGIDVTSALSQGAGIGRYTRELVRAVVREEENFKYTLISAKISGQLPVKQSLLESTKITHKQIPISEQWLYRIWYRLKLPLPLQLFAGHLDLFHSPDFVLPPLMPEIPSLLTVHDLSFIFFPETFPSNLVNYLNNIVPWSIRRATHILADSESTKRDLVNQWNVSGEKVSVLYSGVGENFRPVSDSRLVQAVRKKYKLGEGPYLITVGTVQPRKNYRMLIRAFRHVAEKYPHQLIIAGGEGWLTEEIKHEVDKQRLGTRVNFLGFVDDSDLPALYSGATIFLFPSLYEGFGLPILEAMACGVPVIASDVSSMPEVVGDAGLLLSPTQEDDWAEAIMKLINEPAYRTTLVGAGFRRSRKFSWSRSARQLLAIYRKLLRV